MDKKNELNIFSIVLIIISLISIFFEEYVYSILLFVFIIIINKDIRKLIMKLLEFLWEDLGGKKNKAEGGPLVDVQQQSNRDSIIGNVISAKTVIMAPHSNKTLSDESREKRRILRKIYRKMIKPLKLLNLAANRGLKSGNEYKKIDEAVEEFIDTKIEHEIDVPEIIEKLNEVMGAFRYTRQRLFLKKEEKKLNEGLHGIKSFDFIIKCKEVTVAIEKLLKEIK